MSTNTFARKKTSVDADDLKELVGNLIICWPDDETCDRGCVGARRLCSYCRVPICRKCQSKVAIGKTVPESLGNHNGYGYAAILYMQAK